MPTTTDDWYVLRSSGVVALVLLTAVMVLGVATSGGWRIGGQPRFVTGALHRSISLLSVVFVAIHIVTTLLDHYAGVSLFASLIPFAPATNAFWVGIGVVSSDLVLALIVTSLLRSRMGLASWRATHWLAYLCWPTAFAHGVGMGSDAASWWFQALAFACLAVVVVTTAARVLQHRPGKRLRRPVAT
jgi:sulfoxide reductase heme-binding subunit YedZ